MQRLDHRLPALLCQRMLRRRITTLGTSAVLAKAEAPASAPQAAQERGAAAGVSALRGFKLSSPTTRGRG
ncbi:hypothetical protein ZEAMMB73_Zm00001d012799 [Zea mays]|uniref:Uncharacterized protein n=1 Tax=Zea mays TaxID=4577 RepID=A0A1D6GCL7_MAIZE|nr:hypothetical protein ZEAMMB73_Zm00001d012799 [Zea mays]